MSTGVKLVTFLVLLGFLLPNAYSINVNTKLPHGGNSVTFSAQDGETVKANMVASTEAGFEYEVEGSGNFKDSHWVSNTAGAHAEIGVDILNAYKYKYTYSLSPGQRVWKASDYQEVSARESLYVENADYIKAYAKARNAEGYDVGVSTEVSSETKHACLQGYQNDAWASANEVGTKQEFSTALGDLINTESKSQVSKNPIPACGPAQVPDKNKKLEAGVSTTITSGALSDYLENAKKSSGLTDVSQTGHIKLEDGGAFTSTSTADTQSKTRTSNYGTIYDLDMRADVQDGLATASGNLGYYVDITNPNADKIQCAVDAAESGDAINVAAGTYKENVVIEKSLDIEGSGADQTIVDLQGRGGRAFDILSDHDVTLKGMTIQNGNADYGAGVRNEGTLTMQNCVVQYNYAKYGAGIANGAHASATIKDSTIRYNIAIDGGAFSNSGNSDSHGVLNLEDSQIYGNHASMGGGAIHNNGGIVNINSGRIFDNEAQWGGAIRTQGNGEININGGSIDNNRARSGSKWLAGGAIFNWGIGTINLNGGIVSNNYANRGGGIYNADGGEVVLSGGSITGNIVYDSETLSGEYSQALGGGIYNTQTSVITGNRDLVNYNLVDEIYEE